MHKSASHGADYGLGADCGLQADYRVARINGLRIILGPGRIWMSPDVQIPPLPPWVVDWGAREVAGGRWAVAVE